MAIADGLKREDEAERYRISAKNALESQAYAIKEAVNSDVVPANSDNENLKARIGKIITWIDENDFAVTDECVSQLNELDIILNLVKTSQRSRQGGQIYSSNW